MSCHFHELTGQAEKGYMIVADDISEKTEDAVISLVRSAAETAICFDAGEFDNLLDVKVIQDLLRLPFDTCWIEYSMSNQEASMKRLGTIVTDSRGRIEGAFFGVFPKTGEWLFLFQFYLDGDEWVAHTASKRFSGEFINGQLCTIGAFLSALNCSNVRRVENAPPAKLQRARAKRGKKPLFSYWTLELHKDKAFETNQHGGGTHASPRLHLRRGHPRQYAPNKWTWVQPCAVGNKQLGMVHKDYALAQASNAEIRGGEAVPLD